MSRKRRAPDPKILDQVLVLEAKALVANAFRSGPIEDVHAAKRISQDEMREIMRTAVDRVYALLWARANDTETYGGTLKLGLIRAGEWNDPSTSYLESLLTIRIAA